jgi:hypothetical protein
MSFTKIDKTNASVVGVTVQSTGTVAEQFDYTVVSFAHISHWRFIAVRYEVKHSA